MNLCLSESVERREDVYCLYSSQNKANKLVYITCGETIDIFVQNDFVEDVETTIKEIAEKVDYRNYILGEEED